MADVRRSPPSCAASVSGLVVGSSQTNPRHTYAAATPPTSGRSRSSGGSCAPGSPTATTSPGAVDRSATACSARVAGSSTGPTTATSRGPSRSASTTASAAPAARGKRVGEPQRTAQGALGRLPVPQRPGQGGVRQQRPGRRGLAGRRRPVGGVLQGPDPRHDGVGLVVGGVPQAAVRGGEVHQDRLQQVARGVEPLRVAGDGAESQQTRPRRARSPRAPPGASPATPSREARTSRTVASGARRTCVPSRNRAAADAASTRSGRSSSAPASASAATASPFHPDTTLSSRAGRGRCSRSGTQPGPDVVEPVARPAGRRVAGAPRCRARTCPRRSRPGRSAAQVPSSSPSTVRSCAGVQA